MISGDIRMPGQYELTRGMTLGDLLLRAGGFVESAYLAEVEVSRVDPESGTGTRIAEVFRVDVGDGFPRPETLPAFPLRNHDNVFVRRLPNWELQRNVIVDGEVTFPGSYTLRHPEERLADVIARAGGLLPTAFPDGFRLVRQNENIGPVSVDLSRALADPEHEDNLVLVEGDRLLVPERPATVSVHGAVGLPTSLVFRDGKGVGYYIDNAGGYLDSAKRHDVKIVYTTGRATKVKRFWFDPDVEPGCRILVPEKDEGDGIDWGGTIKDTATILASLATTYLVIDKITED